MRAIVVGARVYPSKEAAKQAIYEVRGRYSAGLATPDDDEFLRDLVAIHPDAEAKISVGIDRFETRWNLGNIGFWIVRTDATETDFSFLKCLYGSGAQDLVRSAMRSAVREQLAEVRAAALSARARCPISGELLTVENCHADHAEPLFIEIANAFASSEGGYEAIATRVLDGAFGRRFSDDAQEQRWIAFHRSHARLRAVSKRTNLSTLRRGVSRRPR
jgi:hypothetical protein